MGLIGEIVRIEYFRELPIKLIGRPPHGQSFPMNADVKTSYESKLFKYCTGIIKTKANHAYEFKSFEKLKLNDIVEFEITPNADKFVDKVKFFIEFHK